MLLPRSSSPLNKIITSNILMMSSSYSSYSSKHYFLKPPTFGPPSLLNPSHTYSCRTLIFFHNAYSKSKLLSRIIHPLSLIRTSGFSHIPHAANNIPRPVYLEKPEEKREEDFIQMRVLRQKMEELGIIDGSICKPGQHNRLICPMCKGGDSEEKSLSLFIVPDGNSAVWTCFRAKCGWKGSTKAFADTKSTSGSMNQIPKVKHNREITEKSLELEPLCSELLAYFAERMISGETLRRNSVMQKRQGNQIVIAFTYRRNGVLVSCKYRDVNKKFWQEKRTEKIFYGLDDIKDAGDIIIVEGEMDKLAMEEAGFRNCVSVPDGAPPSVSKKDLPSKDQDTRYQYLWNCKEYIEKASRIILATDGDLPGQALAEELARRLGRERCWRVRWPKKTEVDHFKDANEVLMYMGPGVLKEVIENAELYPISGLFNFSDYFDEIDAYYHRTLGYELGVSTGWRALNNLYNDQEGLPKELSAVKMYALTTDAPKAVNQSRTKVK